MLNFKKRLRLESVLLVLMPLIASCQTMDINENNSETGWSCLAFLPITWSQSDTPETILQIKEHNAVFAALCDVKHNSNIK